MYSTKLRRGKAFTVKQKIFKRFKILELKRVLLNRKSLDKRDKIAINVKI